MIYVLGVLLGLHLVFVTDHLLGVTLHSDWLQFYTLSHSKSLYTGPNGRQAYLYILVDIYWELQNPYKLGHICKKCFLDVFKGLDVLK